VVDLLGAAVEVADFKICERGLSVPPNNPLAFARALSRVINDAQLQKQLGERGFQFAQSTYQKQRLLDDIESLYDDLMDYRRVPVETPVSRTSIRSGV
jgi:glycosyltransferase involved in cell wall biosynthesis